MLKILFLILVFGWPQAAGPLRPGPERKPSPAAEAREGVTEVTETDFTKLEKIRADRLTSFGVMLGDEGATAKQKFEKAGHSVQPRGLPGSFSIYDDRGKEIMAFDMKDGRVTKLVWFSGMARYLAGDASGLFSPDIVEPESPARLKLLGREDSRSVERNSIGATITCSYDHEGLRLIRSLSRYGDADPVIHLVRPAKQR